MKRTAAALFSSLKSGSLKNFQLLLKIASVLDQLITIINIAVIFDTIVASEFFVDHFLLDFTITLQIRETSLISYEK